MTFLPGVGLRRGAARTWEDSVEALHGVRRQRDLKGMHGSVQLLERPRADDRGRHGFLM